LVSSSMSVSCAGGIMCRNAWRGVMMLYTGLPVAILSQNRSLWHHWWIVVCSSATLPVIFAATPPTHFC
jgi:hypothetical protein